MTFDPKRLRTGELVVAAGGLALLISLFFFKWYGMTLALAPGESFSVSANGWHTHSILRWLMLLTILAALALVVLTATQETAAMPLAASVVATVLAGVTTLCLAYRVLLDEPGPNALIDVRFGAYAGLISCAAIFYGGYLSMRDERSSIPDQPTRVRDLAAPSAGESAPSQDDAPPAA